MTCKKCGTHMFFSDVDTCQRCRKRDKQFQTLKLHYQKLKDYNLRIAILHCRRHRFSFRKIADILDTDIDTITTQWDIILQDGR